LITIARKKEYTLMTEKKLKDINGLNFEQALGELEDIVSSLESGEAGLDEAMAIYARGQQLRDVCNAKLASARLQVEKIQNDKGGNISVAAFNPAE
jgi:exodeoxyribonuclease VII small subunit